MAGADAQRISPRRRDDPSLLGGGAHLRPGRPGTGPPQRRHPRAAVESVRPDAGGPADGLGRATELPVTTRPVEGRRWLCLLKATSRRGFRPKISGGPDRFMPRSWVSSPSRNAPEGFVTDAVMASSRSSSPPGPLLEITRRWRGRSTTWRRQSRSFAERGVIFEEYDVPGLK